MNQQPDQTDCRSDREITSLSARLIHEESDIFNLKMKAFQNGKKNDHVGCDGCGSCIGPEAPTLDVKGSVIPDHCFNGTDQGGYCWKHRHNVHPTGHTSALCRYPCPAHNKLQEKKILKGAALSDNPLETRGD